MAVVQSGDLHLPYFEFEGKVTISHSNLSPMASLKLAISQEAPTVIAYLPVSKVPPTSLAIVGVGEIL